MTKFLGVLLAIFFLLFTGWVLWHILPGWMQPVVGVASLLLGALYEKVKAEVAVQNAARQQHFQGGEL